MTTTTRTTGTAAKVLAALLAVFALVSLSLAFTVGAANADDQVYICHADVNGTNGPNGPQSDDPNGQPNLGHNGQGGQAGTGFNLLHISQNAADNAHMKLHPSDYYASASEIAAGYCGAPTVMYSDTGTATASTWICLNGTGPTHVTANGAGVKVGPQDTPVTPEQIAAARTQDQPSADAALAALLGTSAYTGYTVTTEGASCSTPPPPTYYCPANSDHPTTVLDGPYDATTDAATCFITPPNTPVTPEAAAVAPVAPATVVEPATAVAPEAATVAVPAPAKVTAPAAVPAGDGSSVPQVPTWALALLVLGTVGLAASATRLVTAR